MSENRENKVANFAQDTSTENGSTFKLNLIRAGPNILNDGV